MPTTAASTISRRHLVHRGATAAAALPLAGIPALAGAAEQDPHLGWFAMADALSEEGGQYDDERQDEMLLRSVEYDNLILDTPASTLAGNTVRLRVVARWLSGFDLMDERRTGLTQDEAVLREIIQALEGLA